MGERFMFAAGLLVLLANLATLGCCLKLYTEFAKERFKDKG